MCGIIGCVGKIHVQEEQAFKWMLRLDTSRGEDSAGVCGVTKNRGEWETLKDVGTGYDLVRNSSFEKLMKKDFAMLFGHNRAATRGSVTVENAHPFNFGEYVGCHNGTLYNTKELADQDNINVDSENIFLNMSKEGVAETIKKLQGAFALCWYNAKEHTVNLVRNYQRPLCYCYSLDKRTLFWASEPWILSVALQKAEVKHSEIIQLPVKKLFTISVPRVEAYKVKDVYIKETDIDFFVQPVAHYSAPFAGYTKDWVGNCGGGFKGGRFGGTKSNVRELFDRRSLAKRFVGKTIDFFVIGKKKISNLEFILCEVENEPGAPSLRVFTPPNSDLGKKLLNSIESSPLFQGRVKSATEYNKECYLVCDNRTIVEVADSELVVAQSMEDIPRLVGPKRVRGPGNRFIDLKEYLRRTSNGCACCGDISPVIDAEDIMWVNGGEEYFCINCKTTSIAQQYIAHSL